MRANGSTFKKLILAVTMSAPLFFGIASHAKSFSEQNTMTLDQRSGNYDSPGQRGRRHGPPPEAVEACANLGESEACGFTSPRGDEISGTCQYLHNDEFACVPENGPPGGGRAPEDNPPSE